VWRKEDFKLKKLLKRHEIEQQPYDSEVHKELENHVEKVWKLGVKEMKVFAWV